MKPKIKIQVEKAGTFTGHKDCIYALTPSDSFGQFFTSGSDALVVKWDLAKPNEGELVAKVNNTVYALCHIAHKNQLVVGQNFEGIHLIDLATKKEVKSLKLTDSAIFDIKLFEDKLVISCGDGSIQVVDLETFTILKKNKHSQAHARTLAISPKLRHVAVGYSDNAIRVFNLDNWQLLAELTNHENSIFTLCYSSHSDTLLSGSRDANLKIWNTQKAYELQESIVAHMYTINHIAFREDGKYFATCSKDKSIKVWDAQTFKLLKVIDRARHAGHGTSVNKILWSGQNKLISASDDMSISVWQLEFDENHV